MATVRGLFSAAFTVDVRQDSASSVLVMSLCMFHDPLFVTFRSLVGARCFS